MLSIKLDVDWQKLAKNNENFATIPNRFVNAVLARTTAKLKQEAPADTGQLARSGRHYMTGPAEGEILFDTNYAGFVHDGRGKGGVNYFAIADWVKSKGLPEDAAWPIAVSISKKGTKKQPWARNFIESKQLQIIINAELRRAVNRVA